MRVGCIQSGMDSKKPSRAARWLWVVPFLIMLGVAVYKVVTAPMVAFSLPPLSTADASYTLRGIIDTLPQTTGPDKYIKIHHEALPDFKNKEGKVVGMPEMIMDFEQLAPDVRLTDFKVGDIVDFTFEVRWSPRVVTRVVRMRTLDAGTVLPLKSVTESK